MWIGSNASRKIHMTGMTPYPDQCWMAQMARNLTMADWEFLQPGQYLIYDRDRKFCPAFQRIIDAVGVQRVVLPPQSPDLNAYTERWVGSVKDEVLSRLILFSEHSLRHAFTQYEAHYHTERPHQGKGHVILLPTAAPERKHEGPAGVGNGWAGS